MDKKKLIMKRIMGICTVFMCIAVHLYKIAEIPFGINVDEMGMGYDAWCLSKYGVDRYLNSYPVYLINFGGGQSALYAYLCALALKFFDLSVFSIRLPGIILFLIGVIYQCRLVRLWNDKKDLRTLLTLLFMTVLPVYIMLFRIGMDCNLMLAISSIVFFYFAKAMKKGKTKDFIMAGTFAGILLYTYAISYVVLLVFLCIMMPYLFYIKKLNFVRLLCLGIPMGILACPLILVQIVNMFGLEEMSIYGITISKLFFYRGSDISTSNLSIASVLSCLRCIFAYDTLPYNSVSEFGTVYYLSIPFVLIGFIKCFYEFIKGIKERTWKLESIFVVWFLILFVCGCCMEANVNRLNGIYVSVLFFLVEGVVWLLSFWKEQKTQAYVLTGIVVIYVILFILFLGFYFGGGYQQKYEPLDFFNYSLEEAIETQNELQTEEDRTVYIGEVNQTYIYYLSALQVNPYEYHAVNVLDEANHESISEWGEAFSKYRFYLPESIDFCADYIVGKEDVAYCKKLEQAGFTKYETEHYYIYQFDLNSFERLQEADMIQWNAGVNEANTIVLKEVIQEVNGEPSVVLVGWTYNIQNDTVWDSVYITIGEKEYIAEIIDRTDVVELTGREELLRTGILCIIPVRELENWTKIGVTCIDSLNEQFYQDSIIIQ